MTDRSVGATRPKNKQPKSFSGRRDSGQTSMDLAQVYETWKLAMEIYLYNEKKNGWRPSEEDYRMFAMQFLKERPYIQQKVRVVDSFSKILARCSSGLMF
jgi:hypothetical protein